MHPREQPVLRDIVLVGGGHSHVVVLKRFGMRPLPGVRLTVVCTDTHTPYSGMLPGYVAGHYADDDVHIDLRPLAGFAGARYIRDEVQGIDRQARTLLCRDRPPLAYDLLSINIGSTPAAGGVDGAAEHAIAVKPIRRFKSRWLALLERVRRQAGPVTIAVVGAGAAGVELTLAMQYRLRNELAQQGRDPDQLRFHLFSAAPAILPTHNARVRASFERVLAQRAVIVHRGAPVSAVSRGRLTTADGQAFAADEIVWVTQAGAAGWLRGSALALDPSGFILVRDTLQTVSDDAIFAAGDCAAPIDTALEKAGVFAVRQGEPLAENLRRAVLGQSLRRYRPQRRWLALISTGDRYAVASRGPWKAEGAWVWRWKDRIDRRFMAQFRDLPAMDETQGSIGTAVPLEPAEAEQAIAAGAMRCGGCGAKVGATVLARTLAALQPIGRPEVLLGLAAHDDAAIVRVPPGKALVHTVDYFRAVIDDPWLFGKIAANHALGDIFAMGAEPQSATAIAALPPGLERKIEATLREMLAGAIEVLNEAGCALVGGHSGEGAELALGFAVNGLIDERLALVMKNDGMRAGDALILTKPLGTGTLLAAHARLRATGRWIDEALVAMQQSSRLAARCLIEHGARACTDVTGFGLAGHLLAMTRASAVAVELELGALPALDGAVHTSSAGMVSSLHAANLRAAGALGGSAQASAHPNYPLLFDPQTAGGLLASLPGARADACLDALRAHGYLRAAIVGRVVPCAAQAQSIRLIG